MRSKPAPKSATPPSTPAPAARPAVVDPLKGLGPKLNQPPAAGELADELGTLDRELEPWASKIARREDLRKKLRTLYEDWPASEVAEAVGKRYLVVLGPRGLQRIIDFAKLVKLAGASRFAKYAKCTLEALEANEPPDVIAKVVTEQRTGFRGLKILERGVLA